MKRSERNVTNPAITTPLFAVVFGLLIGLSTPALAANSDFTKVFANIARERTPAVVNISSKQKVKLSRGEMKLREYYGKIFPVPVPSEDIPRQSLGSGFIVEPDGYILTNSHVVSQAEEITVSFGDGHPGDHAKEYKAKVITTDPKLDVALLKIEPEAPLTVIEMGDSDQLETGDWVMAIGNPFGFSQSVTVGVVSAKGRVIGAGPYDDFIQTDAAINQGNSGGPLLDINGKVVGINTAIFTGGGMGNGNIGIGFATPINAIKAVYADLKKGQIKRGWLGVRLMPVSKEMAEKLGLDQEAGALVETVKKDSPAEKAGLKPLDVIVEFEGKAVDSQLSLPKMVAAVRPGTLVKVVVVRDGKKKSLKVTLGEYKDEEAETMEPEDTQAAPTKTQLGMTVEELTPQWTKRLELDPSVKGLVVTDVAPGSPAARSGMQAGDVILSVERQEVRTLDGLNKVLDAAKPGATLLLLVVRDGDSAVVMLKTPEK